MYRIMIARNGYYYVQKQVTNFSSYPYKGLVRSWRKVGGFFHTKAGARAMIRDDKMYRRIFTPSSSVVEYL